jgi:hypothetical protein
MDPEVAKAAIDAGKLPDTETSTVEPAETSAPGIFAAAVNVAVESFTASTETFEPEVGTQHQNEAQEPEAPAVIETTSRPVAIPSGATIIDLFTQNSDKLWIESGKPNAAWGEAKLTQAAITVGDLCDHMANCGARDGAMAIARTFGLPEALLSINYGQIVNAIKAASLANTERLTVALATMDPKDDFRRERIANGKLADLERMYGNAPDTPVTFKHLFMWRHLLQRIGLWSASASIASSPAIVA